jgi:hypothetical protein
MDSLLVKIFATALTFSQVATNPDQVTTQFDPTRDNEKVVGLLRAGCAQMRKVFDIEDVSLDDLGMVPRLEEAISRLPLCGGHSSSVALRSRRRS